MEPDRPRSLTIDRQAARLMDEGRPLESIALLEEAVAQPWAAGNIAARLVSNLRRLGRDCEARAILPAIIARFPYKATLREQLAELSEPPEALGLYLGILRQAGLDVESAGFEASPRFQADQSGWHLLYNTTVRAIACGRLDLASRLLEVQRYNGTTSTYLAAQYVFDVASKSDQSAWVGQAMLDPEIFDVDEAVITKLWPAGGDDFDRSLVADLHGKMTWFPNYQGASADVWRTDMRGLIGAKSAAIQAFQVMAGQCVQAYLARRRRDIAPMIARDRHLGLARCWGITGTRYPDQATHIHDGVLSCVYYAEVPTFSGEHDGSIEFGRPTIQMPVEFPTAVVTPKVRRLLIFPAYTFHRVLACSAGARRTSIAMEFHGSDAAVAKLAASFKVLPGRLPNANA